jgi:hypothetical protein
LKTTKLAQAEEITKQTSLITNLTHDRDEFRSDTKDLSEKSTFLERQKFQFNLAFKTKFGRMTDKLKKADEEIVKLIDKNIIAERNNKFITEEKEKLKLRITKIMARKGKFESLNKTCKKCAKEYKEKENFNWSCRMHQSDWGG